MGRYHGIHRRGIALLACAMLASSMPLAACSKAGDAGSLEQGSSASARSVSFDDGSQVLDAATPYVFSNVDELHIEVLVREGRLADSVGTGDIALAGALEGWQVAGVERTSDEELVVEVKRPEGLLNNGASLAYVEVASQGIVLPEAESADEADQEQGAQGGDEADSAQEDASDEAGASEEEDAAVASDAGGGTEAAEADAADGDAPADEDVAVSRSASSSAPDGAVVVDAEIPEGQGLDGSELDREAITAEFDAVANEPYTLALEVIDPYLDIDFDRSELSGDTLKLILTSSGYAFSEDLSASDFELAGAEGSKIESASRTSGTEAELVLTVPDGGTSALGDAALEHKENETGSSVACSLYVPQPWTTIDLDYTDDAEGTVTYQLELNNCERELKPVDLTVSVDDAEIDAFDLERADDGTYSVTLDASAAPVGSVVCVDVDSVPNVLGEKIDPAPSAEAVEASGGTRALNVKELVISAGKSGASALAQYGWKQLCKTYLDPNLGTSLYDVSNNELLAEIVKVQEQVADVSNQLRYLTDIVEIEAYERALDAARSSVEKVSSAVQLLRGKMGKIQKTADPAERARLIAELSSKSRDSGRVDAIADELPVLYNRIMMPNLSGKGGANLIRMYDNLMAKAYNWGVETYEPRAAFRESVALTWAQGAQIVSLAYGANEADEFENMLNDLDERTKLVSELIGTTCKIDVTELMYYEGIEIDLAGAPSKVEKQPAWFPEEDVPYEHWQCYISDEDLAHWTAVQEGIRKQEALEQQQRDAAPRIYYCNTTGKWYTTLKASDTASKWNDALEHQSKLDGKNYEQWNASSPFGRHTAGKGAQLYPDVEWTTRYMGTSDVKKMQERLRGDATLKSELEEVGFSTAKYLITSEKFTKGGWRNDNCWKMDTFEIASSSSKKDSGFTANKEHFKGMFPRYVEWHTDPADMFVLKIADAPTKN